MKKLERDGKIAVLVSRGYGAGWSTWNNGNSEFLCMDAEIAQAILDGNKAKAVEIAKKQCGDDFYDGGADDLTVEWVERGRAFEISEFDGNASLRLIGEQSFMIA